VTGAILALSAALLQQSGTAEATFKDAAAALRDGNLPEAEKGFQRVLELEPDNIGALGNLGVTYARMERYADAIAVYRRAQKLSPNEPGILLNLAIAYVKQEEYAMAKPLLERLPKTTQSQELLATCELFTGNAARALEILHPLPRSPEVLYLAGTAHLRLKHSAESKAAFEELLATATPAQAHLLLGRAYTENTRFEEALPELRRAVELDPPSVTARLELAKTLISLRDSEGAERELTAILKAKPDQPDAAYYLGALLVQQSREAEGKPLLEVARRARPDAWGSYYYLGRAELQTGQPAKAIPLLEHASALNPDETAVWYQLARAYQAAGRPDDARRARDRHTFLRKRSIERAEQAIAPNRQIPISERN